MADENQGRNGEAVSTRAPRRSAAGNKAWQSLMPHKQTAAAAAAAAAEHLEEEEEEEEERTPPPPATASSRGRGRPPAATTPAAAAILQRKPAGGAPVTPTAARPAASTTAAAAPPQLSQLPQRGMSDDEELEEASSELFPKPPPDQKKAPKRKGRPPKNGGASESGSVSGSHTSGGKKVKLEDSADDFDMDEEEDEDGYGGPPMLNRQISRTPSYNRRACSPTCTKRCCLTEDGKRVSRQTATGVRNDQYDPPYNARPGGKRKPRTPKMPSETPSSEKKSRAPYGSKKAEKEQMSRSMMGGAQFGTSAPGARSMTAVSVGRAVSTMPTRPSIMGGGGGLIAPGSRVVTVGPGGKIQTLSRPTTSPNMTLVSRQRIGGGGGMVAAGGAGPTKYPVAIAQHHQQARLPGPDELLRAENTVDNQYRQARSNFSKHVATGSTVAEFNRVIDLLTVENKRLITAQSDDQEYVDSLTRRIRSLENNVASLQRQLTVTTKAYHGALLEVNAERGGNGGIGMSAMSAAAPPPIRVTMGGGTGGISVMRAAGGGAQLQQQPKMENADVKPKKEEEEDEHDEEKEGGETRAPGAQSSVPAGVPTAAAAAAAGRSVPRLMEQQQEGRGAVAAQMMMNRQEWMQGFEEDDDMYDDIMEEVIEEEEMAYFEDEEEDEEGMPLD